MARLLSIGFELDSTSNFQETDSTTGSPSIQSTNIRSGSFAGRIPSLASGAQKGWRVAWSATGGNGPFFTRTYLNVTTLPTIESAFFSVVDAAGFDTTPRINLSIDNGGLLRLYEQTAGAIGSPSSAIGTNTWYRIEIMIDRTGASGSNVLDARIDGVSFASSSTLTIGAGLLGLNIGGNLKAELNTAGLWDFDDIAVNDASGSFQNTWCGDGKIIELRPNATGDVNTFSAGAGGTAGSANNFTRMQETSPDGNTSYNVATALNNEDLVNVVDSGIGVSDLVNVVHVTGQLTNSTADATTALKFELEKASGGTIIQSQAYIPNSTTYGLPTNTSPRTYPLTLYQDPDGSSWTQATLDTMQIGYKETALGTNHIRVSQVYAMVDYTPFTPPPPATITYQPYTPPWAS